MWSVLCFGTPRKSFPCLSDTFLNNLSTFQTAALERLLAWGAVSLEKSINQPMLPHAIIAVNASDLGIKEEEWDVRIATARLLASVRNTLGPVSHGGAPQIIKYKERWNEKKRISTVEDLIRCYYSSFTVVRLPKEGSYQLLNQQIDKLHKQIVHCCELSHDTKRAAGMLSTSDQLNIYLQSAFDHFSKGLDKPFNFIEVSLKNKPIPLDLGDHVLQLATAMRSLRADQSGVRLFQNLSYIVASCVLLDCVRYRKGMSFKVYYCKTNPCFRSCSELLEKVRCLFRQCPCGVLSVSLAL
jgi:hypothetical protein